MGLDGSLFVWEPGMPVAYVSGYEYDGEYQARGIQVIFPMKRRTVRPLPGLEINLRADLSPGQELRFGGGAREIWVVFRPSSVRPQPDGMMIGYDSGVIGGEGRLVLDICEPWPEGRVRGRLLYAKLRSTVYDQGSGDIVASRDSSFLELWNWPFDLVLDQSPYE